jgi:hypothetical protein
MIRQYDMEHLYVLITKLKTSTVLPVKDQLEVD